MTEFIINYSGVYYKLLQRLLEIQKVPQNPFTCLPAFLRMELGGIKVIFMQCRAERMDIIGFSSSEVTNRHIETVYKVDKLFFGESFEQFAVCLTNRIPAHMRHF